jgi:signal transduction histidine kinase
MTGSSLSEKYGDPTSSLSPNGTQSLVEAELISSVAWLIKLRWIAGVGVILATWVVQRAFNLQVAAGPLYAIGVGILAYNLVFYLVERSLTQKAAPAAQYENLAKWQVGMDWLAMILLVHFSGGIESPAILFFFFHIIIASILFNPRTAFTFAFLAIALLTASALLEYSGLLTHQPIAGYLPGPFYKNSLYVLSLLLFFSSTALITAYLASSIQERLRRREEEVVELSENLRRATIRLQTLNEGARLVSSTLELSQVLERLVKSTAEAMGVRACTIRLLDKSGWRLEPVAVYGLSRTYLDKGPVDLRTNALAREVISGKMVNVPDVSASPLLQYPEEAKQEGIRSMLSAPLPGKDGPLGILRAYSIQINHFTPDDEAFLSASAAQGSIAIENALAYQAIEKLDETKSQFVRMVTHELRSPVSVIRSLLRTLSGGYAGKVSAQQQDILDRAAHRAEFLQKLVDDLLDLAAGKMEVGTHERREPVFLAEAIDKVVKRFEVAAREKQQVFEWKDETPDRALRVMAMPEEIDRVFNNLISNAVKYTPIGGTVRVSMACKDDKARVTVADTGIGIPPEALEHLFEEFYRAPNAREIEREGTGLGLTITRDILLRLGGTITVNSTQNAGSQFVVMLPMIKEVPDHSAGEAREEPVARVS